MKRLYVTDMDGTLLGADSRVSAVSEAMLRELCSRGVAVTVATARTPATVQPLLCNTGISIPAIVMTGAAMWDFDSQRYLDPRFIDDRDVDALIREFCAHGVAPFVYTLSASDGMLAVYHASALSPHELKFYEERSSLPLKKFEFVPQVSVGSMAGAGVVLFLGMAPLERIEALASDIRMKTQLSVSAYPDIFNHSLGYIEVFAPGVSKAAAILELKRRLGAGHVTVYGDNLNDIPMFAVADEAVAVGNALPEVRKAASRVIDRNTDDAVARDIFRQEY